jgi:hypothetical protein
VAQSAPGQTSPEKKLLELIETPGGSIDPAGPVKHKAVRSLKKGPSFIDLLLKDGGLGIFLRLKERFNTKSLLAADLRKVNGILVLVICLLAVQIAFSIARYHKESDKIVKLSQDELKAAAGTAPFVVKKDDSTSPDFLSALLEKIKMRDLFKPVVKTLKGPVEPTSHLGEMLKNLKMVGISYSDSNGGDTYVMIEDSTTKITHFLKKGDMIMDISVADIQPDKVILTYQDEQAELR